MSDNMIIGVIAACLVKTERAKTLYTDVTLTSSDILTKWSEAQDIWAKVKEAVIRKEKGGT